MEDLVEVELRRIESLVTEHEVILRSLADEIADVRCKVRSLDNLLREAGL